jgi:probable enterotoxin D
VRTGPGTSYAILSQIKPGETYAITGETGTWYEIDFRGFKGYVSKSFVTLVGG